MVLGAGGQLGRHLCRQFGDAAIAITRAQLDLRSDALAHDFSALLAAHSPTHIINAAAFTDVAYAEKDDAEAMQVNARAPEILAAQCAASNLSFIHCSTDYVFDGEKNAAYLESDAVRPINRYGASKAAGEAAVLQAYADASILRFSWLYDAVGKNFFTTMRGFARSQSSLRIVADQVGIPTYAGDAARMVHSLMLQHAPSGIFHCVPDGHTSWHGFACAILPKFHPIQPILAAEYSTSIRRPRDSRLDNRKLKTLGIATRHWHEGLRECMEAANAAA